MSPLALPPGTPPRSYVDRQIEGWSVHIERAALQSPKLGYAVLSELTTQLRRIARVVPDAPLRKLRTVRIWIHRANPLTPGAAFHPAREWLTEHGLEPDMAGCVEIGDVEHFVLWSYDQPWMVMHELAHAYHFRFLPKGFGNPEIASAYEAAKASGRYAEVLRGNGRREKAYATTDPMEYFAETTEAYFGQNDFFPFVRAELSEFDPTGFALLRALWGEPARRLPEATA